jgi:L-ascorbate metabolism protein UlaG (beta-lactamase superfamily)
LKSDINLDDFVDLDFLKWIEHAGFLISEGNRNIYIDPFRVKNPEHADIVFISHSHFDHMSSEDISKIAGPDTQFVAPREAASKLSGKKVLAVEPGKEYSIGETKFLTIPAYNVKPERLNFHPKAKGWVGYVIDIGGTRVYHAGDTDLTEEMKKVETDIALVPMGGTYTMGLEEAIEAAKRIKAKSIAPMHYRALLGKSGCKQAEEEFKRRVSNGVILDQVQEPRYSL